MRKIPLIFLFLALSFSSHSETIKFKDGRVIEAEIIEKTDEYIKVDISGIAITYYFDRIENINGKSKDSSSIDKKIDPSGYYHKQGIKYVLEGKFNKAGKHFQKSLKIDKANYYSQSALEALKDFDKGLINQEYISVLFKGMQYFAGKRYQGAAGEFEKAIQMNPNYIKAYLNLGATYYFQEHAIRGFRHLRTYLPRDVFIKPNGISIYSDFIRTYSFVGKYPEVITSCRNSIQTDPYRAEPYYILGITYQFLDRPKLAMVYYKKAIEANSDFSDAYTDLGQVYDCLNQPKEAVACYKKAVKINPNDAFAYSSLGFDYSRFLDKPQHAVNYYQNATEVNPKDIFSYNNLGAVYLSLEQIKEAIDCYQKAIAIEPKEPYGYFNLGIVYYRLTEYELAQENLLEAIRMFRAKGNYKEILRAQRFLLRIPK